MLRKANIKEELPVELPVEEEDVAPEPRVTCSAGDDGPLPQGWLRAGGRTCEDENAWGQREVRLSMCPNSSVCESTLCLCSPNIFNSLANLSFSVLWDSKNGSAFGFNCGMVSLLTHYCAASESLH